MCKKCGEEPAIANSSLGLCAGCRVEYDRERQRKNSRQFYQNHLEEERERRRLYREENRDAIREGSRIYYEENKEKALEATRRSYLQRNYGLTPEEFEQMIESQAGRCAICKSEDPGAQGTFHVDHDHATGRVRALLCNRCNNGLGCFRDDPNLLLAAIGYLFEHNSIVYEANH